MITPRTTRLVRVPDLQTFRRTVADLACEGSPREVRDRLVIVPTRAAAAHLTASIERRMVDPVSAIVLPDFVTRAELCGRLAERLTDAPALLTGAEREVLMAVACRGAADAGTAPPFRLRPGLIAEIVRFYDTLQLNSRSVDTFERLALGALEPGAADDRGAERLVRQTTFLVAAFRSFERLRDETGNLDEHGLRACLLSTPAERPWRHVVVAVGDRGIDVRGLHAVEWDLLTRVPGLERLDVVCTEARLAGVFHERIHHVLPGVAEQRVPSTSLRANPSTALRASQAPTLLVPSAHDVVRVARDREEEVAGFARWVRAAGEGLDRMALVVRRPLPYVYISRDVLTSAGIPSQMFDALPLAAEPFAAALDLVFDFVTGRFGRQPGIALLRSPHFRFDPQIRPRDMAGLDRALGEGRYLGGLDALERTLTHWNDASKPSAAIRHAGTVLLDLARELSPLAEPAPLAEQIDRILAFLARYERVPAADDPLRPRLLRGRAAILEVLLNLRDAHARFDETPAGFETMVQMVRRWIEAHTFEPRTGESGVHVVDAESAGFGDFDRVQLAGLVDGEWPEPPIRNIFYPPALLRELGWPPDADRSAGERAAFTDLLRLASKELVVSTFTLENDAIVSVSSLAELVGTSGLTTTLFTAAPRRVFTYEALSVDPVVTTHLAPAIRHAVERRLAAAAGRPMRDGHTGGHPLPAYSLSALERYQDCPFRFFASEILRLEEPVEDEQALSPREHGKFLHEVFQRFFEAWDRRGVGTITVDRLDEARALFEEVAEPVLARLSDADAALERARLFGSAVSPGIVHVVLGIEASRPIAVSERWLEYRFEGEFSLGQGNGRRVGLKGVADRIDLLAGNRLRVIDYKSGQAPQARRALQVPVYALCAQERLEARGQGPWSVEEAAYVAFAGKRTVVPVVKAGSNPAPVLDEARARVLEVVDGVEQGQFPPRPHELRMCTYCPYPSVCRKDYVIGE